MREGGTVMGIIERNGHRHLCAFILLLIAEENGYGREIHRRLEESFPGFRRDSSTVYRCLRTLVEEGALSFEWVFSDRGDPKKRYRLTESGYADLREWEEDIAVRKRHFDTFLRRYAALKDKGEEARREGEGNPGRFRAE